MPAKSSKETEQDQFDAIIDTLIGENAPLIEAAFAAQREGSRSSVLERFVLTETLTSQLSDALARALTDELAPRIMKVLDEYAESVRKGSGRPAGVNVPSQGQKPGGE